MLVVSRIFFSRDKFSNFKSRVLGYIHSCQDRRAISFLFKPVPSFLVLYNHLIPTVVRRELKLTSVLKDIVHGDVKCENVLIFEKENEKNKESEIHELQLPPSTYA